LRTLSLSSPPFYVLKLINGQLREMPRIPPLLVCRRQEYLHRVQHPKLSCYGFSKRGGEDAIE